MSSSSFRVSARRLIFAGGLLTLLPGCMQTTGDFGRRAHNVWADTLLPGAGLLSATLREEAVSNYPFTDDEQEMRSRAYRFLMPAHERAVFDKALAELRYARVLPAAVSQDPGSYYATLLRGDVRSQTSHYHRLASDIEADRNLIGPFLIIAARVRASDQIRFKALSAAGNVSHEQRQDALDRIAENSGLQHWVCDSLGARLAAYRYALEHLVISGPHRDAIAAERQLLLFERDPKALCSPSVDLRERPWSNPHNGLGRLGPDNHMPRPEIPIWGEPMPSGAPVAPPIPEPRGIVSKG